MNWTEPTQEMQDEWQAWLAERPETVRTIGERFKPWAMYRLTTTGQRCQVIAISENGTVRIYAEHETLGPMTGVEVFGVDPDELIPWEGSELAKWEVGLSEAIEMKLYEGDSSGHGNGDVVFGPMITYRIVGGEP